jgi:putative membrane protein
MRKTDTLDLFKSKKAGISILVVLHIVGVAGFLSPLSEWFVFLTPVNLIVTAGMIWIDSKGGNKLGWPIAFVIMLLGYLIEVVGVHTGLIFGHYAYGEVLGWKILQVPPLIGVNWLIVIWASFSFAVHLSIPKGFRWVVTALLAVCLDYLIEPVAVHFELWHWYGGQPPLQNYVAWFATAAVMGAIFEAYPLVQKPRLGLVAFICQLLFFGILFIAIR